MSGHGKYGKNGWKIVFMNIITVLCVLVVLAGIGGAGYSIIWPKVQSVLEERKEEAEAKRLQEEAEAKRLQEEAEAKRLQEEAEAKRIQEEAEAKRIQEEAEAKRLQEEAEAKRLQEEAEAKRLQEEAEAERIRQEEASKTKEYVSTYEVIVSDRTWIEAYDDALSRSGHLAVINSAEEEQIIEELLDGYDTLHTVWLGGVLKNKSLVWINGQDVTYTQWGSGEPNNETGDEDYLDMYELDNRWYWNDVPNDIKQYYSGKMGYVVEYEKEVE